MNRNSGNVSKPKKLMTGAANNSKPNRKSFQKLSESSSISSNRNSSAQSEDDVRLGAIYVRPQVTNSPSFEEQEQVKKKLQGQLKELRHKLRVLEESVDSKDYSLSTIAREKDRALGEIRRLERSNKQLRNQLNDERNHYLEEKEKFCEEMTKYKQKFLDLKALNDAKKANTKWNSVHTTSKHSLINQQLKWQFSKEKGDFADNRFTGVVLNKSKSQNMPRGNERNTERLESFSCSESHIRKTGTIESLHLYEGDDITLQMAALRTENAKLRSIICERDERNYELCLRFLRMKHYKNDIRNRFQDLENEYLQVIANLMDKIDEARQEFNFIIDQKFKRPLHSTNAMYLQLVQRNSRMAFENASLRLENQCLKKELNKSVNGISEYYRKIEPAVDDPGFKSMENEPKSDSKLKRIKKNVNFNEIRTIYERDLAFKNSDTDSNYMSKTSTTIPSNGSLADQKSNESILEIDLTKKIQPSLQPNTLPNEILNKIFKRIDNSSSQSLDTNGTKDLVILNKQKKMKDIKGNKSNSIQEKSQQKPSTPLKKSNEDKQKELNHEIIEYKIPTKIVDSSSPSESKESIRIDLNLPPTETSGNASTENHRTGKPGKLEVARIRPLRSRLRSQEAAAAIAKHFGRTSESGNGSVNVSTRRPDIAGRIRQGRFEQISQTNQKQTFQTRSRLRMREIRDSCGLQEKLEFSDLEIPKTEIEVQISDVSKQNGNNREKPEDMNPRIEIPDSDDEFLEGLGRNSTSLIPALGSRSRSSNRLSLQEELMQATRSHLKNVNRTEESDLTQARRSEGSKRFSHRLISTSPEQLKHILTESHLGACYRMAPIIVGHATTEINQAFNYHDPSKEIVFQLVIPTVGQTPFTDQAETIQKVEKETSVSGLSPTEPNKPFNLPADMCTSDIRIPVSSLPTSSSTVDMVDSAVTNDRNNIMLRTLSAPGLLESSWLDPYTICEMRDCGTNT